MAINTLRVMFMVGWAALSGCASSAMSSLDNPATASESTQARITRPKPVLITTNMKTAVLALGLMEMAHSRESATGEDAVIHAERAQK